MYIYLLAKLIHKLPKPQNEPREEVSTKQSTGRIATVQRHEWHRNYKARLEKSLARNDRVDKELTPTNYKEQFNFSICVEEQKHMELLAKKYVCKFL